MILRLGFDMSYNFPAPATALLMLNVHPSVLKRVGGPDRVRVAPKIPLVDYTDSFGNRATRVTAPAGILRLSSDFLLEDTGAPDPMRPQASQYPIQDLPDDALQYLIASRYCEVDLLSETAWNLFETTPPGWARVRSICDWVRSRMTFSYPQARRTRTAFEAYNERVGVCRDYQHLAITLCRAMHIPARYATGYLGDIGVPVNPDPMDFSAWFEAYLDGAWHVFDARNATPRIGRTLMAVGRDAADVALMTSFGSAFLLSFQVWTDLVPEHSQAESIASFRPVASLRSGLDQVRRHDAIFSDLCPAGACSS